MQLIVCQDFRVRENASSIRSRPLLFHSLAAAKRPRPMENRPLARGMAARPVSHRQGPWNSAPSALQPYTMDVFLQKRGGNKCPIDKTAAYS